jgi:hypothetical protein
MNWAVVVWCCRLLIGGVLLASALGKSLSLQGFVYVLVTYGLFPDRSLWPLALGITGVEWVLAAWILVGWHRIEPQRTLCHWAYHHPAPWSRSSELWLLRRILPSTVAVVFSARRSRPSRDLRTVANRSEEI